MDIRWITIAIGITVTITTIGTIREGEPHETRGNGSSPSGASPRQGYLWTACGSGSGPCAHVFSSCADTVRFALTLFGLDTQTGPTDAARRGFEWLFAYRQSPCAGERVVASWYALGRRTASGEAFNPGGYTAAHRTLPFGSHVTVSNPHNGKSVTAIINDRGPFTRGVTLHLARGAANAIGMYQTQ